MDLPRKLGNDPFKDAQLTVMEHEGTWRVRRSKMPKISKVKQNVGRIRVRFDSFFTNLQLTLGTRPSKVNFWHLGLNFSIKRKKMLSWTKSYFVDILFLRVWRQQMSSNNSPTYDLILFELSAVHSPSVCCFAAPRGPDQSPPCRIIIYQEQAES